MFEYFPTNYVWSLAVLLSLETGGAIDEIDRACRPLVDVAARGHEADTVAFCGSWSAMAEDLAARGEADEADGRLLTAASLYARAANYLGTAERMQRASDADRNATYRRVLDLMERSIALGTADCQRVEVPYPDASGLPGYLVRPAGATEPVPCVIQWNGLDSTKEMMLRSGLADHLAAHGIATLVVDTPGSGEALRLRGLTASPDTERWAAACVDFLETAPGIDADRIGLVGWSLGGYYAPRAAAFERRLKACVAWGANHNWGRLQDARLRNEGERPVPHYWEHVLWAWGQPDVSTLMRLVRDVTLDGVVEQITVPFLIVHGADDRQIPVADAHQSYAQAASSPRRELKVFDERTGANEHIGLDNLSLPMTYIGDWLRSTLTPENDDRTQLGDHADRGSTGFVRRAA